MSGVLCVVLVLSITLSWQALGDVFSDENVHLQGTSFSGGVTFVSSLVSIYWFKQIGRKIKKCQWRKTTALRQSFRTMFRDSSKMSKIYLLILGLSLISALRKVKDTGFTFRSWQYGQKELKASCFFSCSTNVGQELTNCAKEMWLYSPSDNVHNSLRFHFLSLLVKFRLNEQ